MLEVHGIGKRMEASPVAFGSDSQHLTRCSALRVRDLIFNSCRTAFGVCCAWRMARRNMD